MPILPWSQDCLDKMRTVSSFGGLGDIAVESLKQHNVKVHEICGPISSGGFGCMQKNLLVFRTAINVMSARGHTVFNPLPLQDAMLRLYHPWREENGDGYCWPILENIYAPIFESGYVECGCFIPNWQGSKGTEWERKTLKKLGIKIFDIPEKWLMVKVGA